MTKEQKDEQKTCQPPETRNFSLPMYEPSAGVNVFFFSCPLVLLVLFGASVEVLVFPTMIAALVGITSPMPAENESIWVSYRPAIYSMLGALIAVFAGALTGWSGTSPNSSALAWVALLMILAPLAWSVASACWRMHQAIVKVVHRHVYLPIVTWISLSASIAYLSYVRPDDGAIRFEVFEWNPAIPIAMLGVLASLLIAAMIQMQTVTRRKKKLRKQKATAVLLSSTLIGAIGIGLSIVSLQTADTQWLLDSMYLAAAPTILLSIIGTMFAEVRT